VQIGLKWLSESEIQSLAEDTKRFYAAGKRRHKSKQPDLTTAAGLQEAREARQLTGPLSDREIMERIAEADGRRVPVRIIRPKRGKLRGVYLNIPGGGFYLSEAARNDAYNAMLADGLGVAVVSVEYRLAPENPYPAAPDDCEVAARWLAAQAQSVFGTSRLIIGGTSAGSTLAMTTLLRLRDGNLAASFSGTVLQYGAYDLSGQTPGGRLYSREYFIQAYVGKIADKTQPDISPLYGDLRSLPPTLVVVGTADILMEDSFALAARLSAAGNEVDLRVYPEARHGFTAGPTKMAAAANKDIISWVARR